MLDAWMYAFGAYFKICLFSCTQKKHFKNSQWTTQVYFGTKEQNNPQSVPITESILKIQTKRLTILV